MLADFKYTGVTDENQSKCISTAIACAMLNATAYQQQFGNVAERLLAPIMMKQALFQVYNDEVVGVLTWGKLSNLHATIYKNDLRPLVAMELQSGNDFWVLDCFCELGDFEQLLLEFRRQVPQSHKVNMIQNNKLRVL